MSSSDGWQVLAQHIKQARRASDTPRRADFARVIGVSGSTLYNLEAGRRRAYSPDTVAAVEIALGWRAGSVERVVTGGRPVRDRDPGLDRLLRAWRRLSPDARQMLIAIAETALERTSS